VAPGQATDDPALERLDEGERAAIELAIRIGADLILMDDRDGVTAARDRGFAVTGTLGILDLAARRDLIQLDEALARLRATSFRCRPEFMEALLAQHAARRKDG
jgi:predicted nucleic acid-binding protein